MKDHFVPREPAAPCDLQELAHLLDRYPFQQRPLHVGSVCQPDKTVVAGTQAVSPARTTCPFTASSVLTCNPHASSTATNGAEPPFVRVVRSPTLDSLRRSA